MVELVRTRFVAISELVDRIARADPARMAGDVFKYVDLGSVDQERKVIRSAKSISTSEAPSRARQVLKTDDVLVATVRPNLNGVARVPADLDGSIASTGFCVLRSKIEHLDPLYLFHWVQSSPFVDDMVRKATGASYPAVSDKLVLNSNIPLPTLQEQQRVAATLDKADQLRTKRRRALAKLDDLTQSIFDTMFGDLGEYQTVTFDELCGGDFRNGVSPSTRGLVQQRVLTLTAVTGDSFDAGASKIGVFDRITPREQRVTSSSLLICRGNGNLDLVGRGHFPPRDHPEIVFPDTVIAARPDLARVTSAFLEHVWNSPEIRSQLVNRARTTNGTFKVNQSMLGEIVLPEPPMSLQNAFSERIALIERLRARHRAQLHEFDALFTSLQSRAFRAQL